MTCYSCIVSLFNDNAFGIQEIETCSPFFLINIRDFHNYATRRLLFFDRFIKIYPFLFLYEGTSFISENLVFSKVLFFSVDFFSKLHISIFHKTNLIDNFFLYLFSFIGTCLDKLVFITWYNCFRDSFGFIHNSTSFKS